MREEDLYELANDELNSRNRKADLWARACALATDDVDEARYLYTNLRVEELAIEHEVDLTQANETFSENLEDPDPTLALTPTQGGNTTAQRIPDNDDESNLTPAQLALKRVNDSMGGDSTNQLPTGLSLQEETASQDAPSGVKQSDSADGDLELSLDDILLANPGNSDETGQSGSKTKDADADNKPDDNPGNLVLGDLTSDSNSAGDNTIHIDADSSVLDFEADQGQLGQTGKNDSDNPITTDKLRSEEVTLANSNAFFTDDKSGEENGTATNENKETKTAKADDSAPASGSSHEAADNNDAFVKESHDTTAAEETQKSNSFADESLAALMELEPAGSSAVAATGITATPDESATTAPESNGLESANSTGLISDSGSDSALSSEGSPEPDISAASDSQSATTIDEADFENFSLSKTDEITPAIRKSAQAGLIQNDADDDNAGEISDLIGSGTQPEPEPGQTTEQEAGQGLHDASADEIGDRDELNVAAMQDAGAGVAREFAIYQNSSGIVSAVPKGGNLKAMLFTLPWLVSRRLWGHSLVYLLLLLVVLAAVIATATIVFSQWPNVAALDLGAALAFALLAVLGLFYLPYRFANSWQEEKIASKGYEYQNDQLAGTVAGAEQSYLLSAKNRVEKFESESDFAKAA